MQVLDILSDVVRILLRMRTILMYSFVESTHFPQVPKFAPCFDQGMPPRWIPPVTRGLRVMREQLFNWVSTHDLELLESTLGTLRVALVRQGKANSI
jgi:hypothetical protein